MIRLTFVCLLCATVASAQSVLPDKPQPVTSVTPQDTSTAWPPAQRPIADMLSTAIEGTVIAMDVIHDLKSAQGSRWAVAGCDALKYSLVEASMETLKHLTHVERPDGSDDLSFPSGHTTNAFAAINGWQWGTSLTLAIGTAYLRTAANRHHWSDVIAGAVLGSAINFGVSRIPACRGTIQ